MAHDYIDQIIEEFTDDEDISHSRFLNTINRMAGEISRLRHTHQVKYELERSGGSWVSYSYSDSTHITSVHASELDALRYALDNHDSGVTFLPYGITIYDHLRAKENPQR